MCCLRITENKKIISFFGQKIYCIDVGCETKLKFNKFITGTGYSDACFSLAKDKAYSELAERISFLDKPLFKKRITFLAGRNLEYGIYSKNLTNNKKKLLPINLLTIHSTYWDQSNVKTSAGFAAHTTRESSILSSYSELIERYITNLVSIGKLSLGKPFIKTKNFTGYQISIFDGFYSVSKIKHKNNIGYGACFSYNKDTSTKNSLLEAVVLADGIISYGMRAVGCRYSYIHKTHEITNDIREFIYIVERKSVYINDQFRFVHQAIFY